MKRNAHSNAYVGNASIAYLEALDIVTHFYDCADGFMARDQLLRREIRDLINAIDPNREPYRELGDELAVVDVCVSAAYAC